MSEENYSIEEYFKHLKKTIEIAERVESKLERSLRIDFVRNLFLYSILSFVVFYLVTLDRITNISRGSIPSIIIVLIPLAMGIMLMFMAFKRWKILKNDN